MSVTDDILKADFSDIEKEAEEPEVLEVEKNKDHWKIIVKEESMLGETIERTYCYYDISSELFLIENNRTRKASGTILKIVKEAIEFKEELDGK